MIAKEYHSNGKIILTGEYLVMQGALALVLPLKIGQSLSITQLNEEKRQRIIWNSFYEGDLWFNAEFSLNNFSIIKCTNKKSAEFISRLLQAIKFFRPELFQLHNSIKVETSLGFNPDWGLGSSSTLIADMAQWAAIDPYKLFQKFAKGSGYDIAATTMNGPFTYKVTKENYQIEKVDFSPSFSDKLFFVYLGTKQNSEIEVMKYLKSHNSTSEVVNTISTLTKSIIYANNLDMFETFIVQHEKIISDYIKKETIKKLCFSDFQGEVKSLGAWGGDFVLMTCRKGKAYLMEYLKTKHLNTCFQFDELILNRPVLTLS